MPARSNLFKAPKTLLPLFLIFITTLLNGLQFPYNHQTPAPATTALVTFSHPPSFNGASIPPKNDFCGARWILRRSRRLMGQTMVLRSGIAEVNEYNMSRIP
ncbi:hypothetical protein TWF569_009519 [Orbilia oligospora]|nr:hypothetical protein TWF103_006855 [Orbilia oligospora]KAF3126356.1 hypothetical protein TWF594_001165 [Orbilia oligospora]KAF3136210.1 hypothetical protein TWF569_009519 [Orbilia oligospora]